MYKNLPSHWLVGWLLGWVRFVSFRFVSWELVVEADGGPRPVRRPHYMPSHRVQSSRLSTSIQGRARSYRQRVRFIIQVDVVNNGQATTKQGCPRQRQINGSTPYTTSHPRPQASLELQMQLHQFGNPEIGISRDNPYGQATGSTQPTPGVIVYRLRTVQQDDSTNAAWRRGSALEKENEKKKKKAEEKRKTLHKRSVVAVIYTRRRSSWRLVRSSLPRPRPLLILITARQAATTW